MIHISVPFIRDRGYKMKNVKSDWFIEPKDEQSNKRIAEFLGGQQVAESICENIVCADGQRRNLYRCQFAQIRHLWPSRQTGLKFNVFCQKWPGLPNDLTNLVREWLIAKTIKKEANTVPA